MTQREYDKSVVQLKRVSVITAGLASVTIVGEAAFALFAGGSVSGELAMLTGSAAIIALSCRFAAVQNKYRCIKCE